jgi:hypothetical protein
MSKTLIWVVVGILAVAGLTAVAFMQFGPRVEPAASAVPAPAVPASAVPASVAPTLPAPTSAVPVTPVPVTAAPAAAPISPSTTAVAQPAALVPNATPTIDELIQNQALYEGTSIALTGTILTQCTAGCEFALDDGTGVLSVQLEGKGKDRLIPLGKVGKRIEIRGTFRTAPRPQVVIEDPNGWQFVK